MRSASLVVATLLLGAAIATAPNALAQTPGDSAVIFAAKKKVRHTASSRGRQIACTVLGCRPVPAGCHPRRGLDSWGNPLDYDLIECP
jgi:hypothetical protein